MTRGPECDGRHDTRAVSVESVSGASFALSCCNYPCGDGLHSYGMESAMVVNMRCWVHNLAVWCYAHGSSGRIGVLAEKIGRASRLVHRISIEGAPHYGFSRRILDVLRGMAVE
jgi:hypothetical protein